MGQPGAGRSGAANPPGKARLADTARSGMQAGLF
jgi:hypothetical protein